MLDILNNVNNKFVILSVVSEVKLGGGKKNEMVGCVKKKYKMLVELSRKGMYESKMKDEVNEDFVVGERKWGVRVDDGCIIENKGNMYVECYFKNMESEVVYYLNDVVIEKENVVGLKVNERNDVGILCLKLDNIDSIEVHI